MKKLILIYVLFISNFLLAEDFIKVDDLKSLKYTIERVLKKNDKFSFKFCNHQVIPSSCEYIGDPSGYAQWELDEITNDLKDQSAFWRKGIVLAGGVVGGVIGGAIGLSTATYTFGGSLVLTSSLFGGGAALGTYVTNEITGDPLQKNKSLESINHSGIQTDDVYKISSEELLRIKENLDYAFSLYQ